MDNVFTSVNTIKNWNAIKIINRVIRMGNLALIGCTILGTTMICIIDHKLIVSILYYLHDPPIFIMYSNYEEIARGFCMKNPLLN